MGGAVKNAVGGIKEAVHNPGEFLKNPKNLAIMAATGGTGLGMSGLLKGAAIGAATTPPNAASVPSSFNALDRYGSPNLQQPYQQHMPSEYFGNQQIHDPTAILDAYMKNMPDFLNASKTTKL